MAFLVCNKQEFRCGGCQEVHEYITKNCTPLAFPDRWRQDYAPEFVAPIPEGLLVSYFAESPVESALERDEVS